MRTAEYTAPPASPAPLKVLSIRVSPDERALVDAVATLAQTTASQLARELVRTGAKSKLRELTSDPPGAAAAQKPTMVGYLEEDTPR